MVPQVVASGSVPGGHSPKISGSASSLLTSFDSLGKARVERGCAISDEEHATRMEEVCNSFVNVREQPAFHEDTRGVRMLQDFISLLSNRTMKGIILTLQSEDRERCISPYLSAGRNGLICFTSQSEVLSQRRLHFLLVPLDNVNIWLVHAPS